MQCDLCGKEEELFKASIEGVEMNVCKKCGGFGKILGPVETERTAERPRKKKRYREEEQKRVVERVVGDFGERVKKRREEKGWTQEELAEKIAEKESVIHKIESGHFEPSMQLTRKIERFLGIKLTERIEEKKQLRKKEREGQTLTIGDMINLKR